MKKQMRRIVIVILAAVFAVSLGGAVHQRIRYGENDRAVSSARRMAGVPEVSPRPAAPVERAEEEAEGPAEADPWTAVDLEALQAVNPDVAGWIAIPGTEISYPLIRPRDNETYLTHSWDMTATSAGAIFLDYRAAWDPRGFNTIVYGHNMRNGTMFGSLRSYRREGYWEQCPTVCLVDGGGVHYYDIFAAWEPRVTDVPFQTDVSTEEGRRTLIDTALERSVIRTGVIPTVEDEILTLSTCAGVGHATRWVVQAALRTETS